MSLNASSLYLDANATLPLWPFVKETLKESLDFYGNPSSVHRSGRFMRRRVEEVREKIARSLGVQSAQVIFNSGATEANTTVLRTYEPHNVFLGSGEHPSVSQVYAEAKRIPLTPQGHLDLHWLQEALQKHCEHRAVEKGGAGPLTLISVAYANHETGILQPLKEVVALAQRYGARVHTDAAQVWRKHPLSFKDLGVDYMSLSGHKIGAPQGIGALVVGEEAPLNPLLLGGGQERRRRSGTENVLGILGMGAALDSCTPALWETMRPLRDTLERSIAHEHGEALVFPECVERLPHVSSLRMPGVDQQKQVMAFDLRNIAISAGSACSSGKIEPSPVFQAMGKKADDIIRISLPYSTTLEDVHYFVSVWKELCSAMGSGYGPEGGYGNGKENGNGSRLEPGHRPEGGSHV